MVIENIQINNIFITSYIFILNDMVKVMMYSIYLCPLGVPGFILQNTELC